MKNTVNKNSNVTRTRQKRLMLVSNFVIYAKKKLRFIKYQEKSSIKQYSNYQY